MLKLASRWWWCSLAVSLIGCAGSDHADHAATNDDHPQAATSPSASPSSPSPAPSSTTPAPLGPLSVQLVSGPLEGFTILFHDADGNIIGSTKTDANGHATAPDDLAPAQVTAVLGGVPPGGSAPPVYRLVTWTGVERGDVLTAISPDDAAQPDAATPSAFTVTVPGAYPNATLYSTVEGGCYDENQPKPDGNSPLTFNPRCWGTESALLVQATNDDGQVLAFAFQKGLPALTTDAPIALPWLPPTPFPMTVTGLSDQTSPSIALSENVNGALFTAAGAIGNGPMTFGVPQGFADSYIAQAMVNNGTAGGLRAITKLLKGDATAAAFDFTTEALPAMTGQTQDVSDPNRPALAWTSPDLGSVDGGLVEFAWGIVMDEGNGPPIVLMVPGGGSWDIYVAPGTKNVKVPVLPAEAASWLPTAGATQGSVRFDDIDAVRSYAAYRQAIAGEARVLPQSTTVRTTSTGALTL